MRRLCLALALLLVASTAQAHSHNAEASARGGGLHMSGMWEVNGFGLAVPLPCTSFSLVYTQMKYTGDHSDRNGTIDLELKPMLGGVRYYWKHPEIEEWLCRPKKNGEGDGGAHVPDPHESVGQPRWAPYVELLGGVTHRKETLQNGSGDSRSFQDISASINGGIDVRLIRFIHVRVQLDSLVHGLRGQARVSFGGSVSLAVGFHPFK